MSNSKLPSRDAASCSLKRMNCWDYTTNDWLIKADLPESSEVAAPRRLPPNPLMLSENKLTSATVYPKVFKLEQFTFGPAGLHEFTLIIGNCRWAVELLVEGSRCYLKLAPPPFSFAGHRILDIKTHVIISTANIDVTNDSTWLRREQGSNIIPSILLEFSTPSGTHDVFITLGYFTYTPI